MTRSRIAYLALAIALVTAAAFAQSAGMIGGAHTELPEAETSPDQPSQVEDERRLPLQPLNDYGVTQAQVGDADSFGRNLRWLGLSQGRVYFDVVCPAPGAPSNGTCVPIANLAAETAFDAPELARIELPAGASTSLLCHWLSPNVGVSYRNLGTARAAGYLSYWPTVTLRSAVLADPALINPQTGAPFGGRIDIALTSHGAMLQEMLEPGVSFAQRSRDTQGCVGGLITRRALVESYGLSPAQADAVFANPMQVGVGMKGVLRNVRQGSIQFGVRYIGD